jgi:hypothetical protein
LRCVDLARDELLEQLRRQVRVGEHRAANLGLELVEEAGVLRRGRADGQLRDGKMPWSAMMKLTARLGCRLSCG